MKRIVALLSFFYIASRLAAVAPYPCTVTAEYKGQRYPVVSVHGYDPWMLVNGKEKETWQDPRCEIKIAGDFADNFVTSPPGNLAGLYQTETIGELEYGHNSARTYFEAQITAAKTIKHGFAAVVVYTEQLVKYPWAPRTLMVMTPSIIVHELPKLAAGKVVKVKFSVPGTVIARRGDKYITQIFDDEGHEVPTSESASGWQYYALRNRMEHFNALQSYLAKSGKADLDATPWAMPKPLLPRDAVKPAGEFTVNLSVDANGHVSAVDASQVTDTTIRQCVVDALGDWLYLPKLQAGVPVATKIEVPLKF